MKHPDSDPRYEKVEIKSIPQPTVSIYLGGELTIYKVTQMHFSEDGFLWMIIVVGPKGDVLKMTNRNEKNEESSEGLFFDVDNSGLFGRIKFNI